MSTLIIFRFEKSITQRQLLNASHIRIIHKIRIDIEEHWHVHRLPSIQPLLLKAETLDLAEVRCDLARRDAVCRHPNDILVTLIRSRVERKRRLAGENLHLALLRYEFPRQHVGHRSVEGDAYTFRGCDGLQADGRVGTVSTSMAWSFDGLASPSCGLADHFVKGD